MKSRIDRRMVPAEARNIEEILDIITYILNIIERVITLFTDLFGGE